MHLKYSKQFQKNFIKRISHNRKLAEQFQQRLNLFFRDTKNPVLKDHKLKGSKKYLRSFSITGDVRVLYYQKGDYINLVDIGTHNQVY